jgi:excisionase family DNA binding protein
MAHTKFLFSKKQAAEALSVSLRTLDNLISKQRLSVTRVGKRVLIPREALEEFARGAPARKS